MINFTKVDKLTYGAIYLNKTRHETISDDHCGPKPWLFPENLNLSFDQVIIFKLILYNECTHP